MITNNYVQLLDVALYCLYNATCSSHYVYLSQYSDMQYNLHLMLNVEWLIINSRMVNNN